MKVRIGLSRTNLTESFQTKKKATNPSTLVTFVFYRLALNQKIKKNKKMKSCLIAFFTWMIYIAESCSFGETDTTECPSGWDHWGVRCCEQERNGYGCVADLCTCGEGCNPLDWNDPCTCGATYTRSCDDPSCPSGFVHLGVACTCDPTEVINNLIDKVEGSVSGMGQCAPTLLTAIANFGTISDTDIAGFLLQTGDAISDFTICMSSVFSRRRMASGNDFVIALEIGADVSAGTTTAGASFGVILDAADNNDIGKWYITSHQGITFDLGFSAFITLQFYTSMNAITGSSYYGSLSVSPSEGSEWIGILSALDISFDYEFGFTSTEFESVGYSMSLDIGGVPGQILAISFGTGQFLRWLTDDEITPGTASLTIYCDNSCKIYRADTQSNPWGSKTLVGSADSWKIPLEISMTNTNSNTNVFIDAQDNGGVGGILACMHRDGQTWCTKGGSNFKPIYSSVKPIGTMTGVKKGSGAWGNGMLSSNGIQDSYNAYWIWQKDVTNNRMIFRFNFKNVI
eukprot:305037_1